MKLRPTIANSMQRNAIRIFVRTRQQLAMKHANRFDDIRRPHDAFKNNRARPCTANRNRLKFRRLTVLRVTTSRLAQTVVVARSNRIARLTRLAESPQRFDITGFANALNRSEWKRALKRLALVLVPLPPQKFSLLVLAHLLATLLDHTSHDESSFALWSTSIF